MPNYYFFHWTRKKNLKLTFGSLPDLSKHDTRHHLIRGVIKMRIKLLLKLRLPRRSENKNLVHSSHGRKAPCYFSSFSITNIFTLRPSSHLDKQKTVTSSLRSSSFDRLLLIASHLRQHPDQTSAGLIDFKNLCPSRLEAK